jgi:hypothetical protein
MAAAWLANISGISGEMSAKYQHRKPMKINGDESNENNNVNRS